MELEQLQKKVDELTNRIEMMEKSSTFPREIGDAISEYISDIEKTISRVSTVDSSSRIYKAYSLSGNAETINVPAFPDGYRAFNVGGRTLWIPYYNLS